MRCSKCRVDKEPEDFYRQTRTSSGRMYRCKKCVDEHSRKKQLEHIRNGLCQCGRPRIDGLSVCPSCKSAQRKSQAKKAKEVKRLGLCIYCKRVPAADGYSECDICAAKRSANRRGGHHADIEARRILFDQQNGLCPICSRPLEGWLRMKHAVVDHDHQSGQIRGLLHSLCNQGIGCFGDSPAILRAAAAYLESRQIA